MCIQAKYAKVVMLIQVYLALEELEKQEQATRIVQSLHDEVEERADEIEHRLLSGSGHSIAHACPILIFVSLNRTGSIEHCAPASRKELCRPLATSKCFVYIVVVSGC